MRNICRLHLNGGTPDERSEGGGLAGGFSPRKGVGIPGFFCNANFQGVKIKQIYFFSPIDLEHSEIFFLRKRAKFFAMQKNGKRYFCLLAEKSDPFNPWYYLI